METKNKERVGYLKNVLTKAASAYYNSGETTMSDKEFDALEAEYANLTGKRFSVGAKVTALNKKRHEYPALSLNKTKDVSLLQRIFSKDASVLMWKMDGSTVCLTYDNGKLTSAVTRGDGYVGSDITHNAPFIKGIPMEIPYKEHLVVRGEAVMSYADFDALNRNLPEDEQYANPRNLANATIAMLDANEGVRVRPIAFKAFDLVNCASFEEPIPGFSKQLDFLEELGFGVVEHELILPLYFEKTIEEWSNRVEEYGYPVDGLVVADDDRLNSLSMPGTEHHPNELVGMALKWADETVETTLRDIEWSASRTGLLNPVAVFDPVELEGTTVSRATLHNLSFVADKDLRVGDKITVYKANKIIPAVDQNLSDRHERVKNISSYVTINKCPVCGGVVSWTESKGGTYSAYCSNPFCGAKKIGLIAHAAERDCLNIKGLSEKKIEFLINNGFIENLSDLFKLKYRENESGIGTLPGKPLRVLENCEGWEMKSVDNLLNAIDDARDTDFVAFLHAMSIPNIGKGQAKELKKYLEANYDSLFEEYVGDSDGSYDLIGLLTNMVAGKFDFTQIDGFGAILANSLFKWVEANLVNPVRLHLDIDDPACETIRVLNELRFHDKPTGPISESAISGKTFVITGSVHHFANREAVKSFIESKGGKVSGSVSKNTDFLINNDVESTSGKNKKAKELGIEIISEDDFLNKFATEFN